ARQGKKSHPFVAVNFGAIAESLLEAELFGYEEGAFTGSRRGGRAGLFEIAHRGTTFLAGICRMQPPCDTPPPVVAGGKRGGPRRRGGGGRGGGGGGGGGG
ncbi:sigma 54-interacting transcriptional regulator, partial [Escherichia coli]|uniref:sigma 54-interacting transcriptional regulator n=1 Tax=Escherichia coli TaxID=562 RepID=UPI002023D2AA